MRIRLRHNTTYSDIQSAHRGITDGSGRHKRDLQQNYFTLFSIKRQILIRGVMIYRAQRLPNYKGRKCRFGSRGRIADDSGNYISDSVGCSVVQVTWIKIN